MRLYYQRDGVKLYHGDVYDAATLPDVARILQGPIGLLVYDPPWDNARACAWNPPATPSTLAFTDGKWAGNVVRRFGAPAWLFTWDTMAPWQTGPRRPLQQTKHCFWYGDLDTYQRDATLWGEPPPAKDHPSTKSRPLHGRRLADLWRQSLRWLHHPTAGAAAGEGSGVERFGARAGDGVMRHAKPFDWVRCLVGNCSSGLVFDPFVGSGPSLRAALELGRPAIGFDLSEEACDVAARWLGQPINRPQFSADSDEECDIYPLSTLKIR